MAGTFVYVDGESHYIRAQNSWAAIHGADAHLRDLRYVDEDGDSLVLINPAAKVFWTRRMHPNANRITYFTAIAGEPKAKFEVQKQLRSFSIDSEVVHEPKTRADQRANALRSLALIEKAKGVDIALAVRMISDAHHHAFDECHLYTSDVDFLPVIELVRGLGKRVFVHGFSSGLAEDSQLLVIPDRFYDLEQMLREECTRCASVPPQCEGGA
ncbi:NYN domain protein [Caulifigura coniformis]|uniref:NYN domain protein n=1 Tax=Caulifigura coniformis TaxID=2527983 RepID=A0A517SAB0_9PLAN|nr:NYN domain-containing protein [Caulifigura coniformis]QDT53016.1 NYN domain protein [Caulifigura coniformis]